MKRAGSLYVDGKRAVTYWRAPAVVTVPRKPLTRWQRFLRWLAR